MARFKAIWGPYREEVQDHRIKWFFSCLLLNDEVRGYTLRFYFETRKFSVKPHTGKADSRYARALSEQGKLALLPEAQRGIIEGERVTDILRDRLDNERIARATARAIAYRRE
ncbi:hypothetical protein [Rhizobium sp. SSA_523]|uniref:hypothetical protein n=1 Tax=Rhizobium sp. SSA_523 TaxID=2952477 RepID=UPI002658FC4A|nr:hypothetical protein [Rhizobium sp. SSA_523]